MRRFILFLFTLLGFGAVATSCSDSKEPDITCEYGCPWVEFSIKARVVDKDGNPIEGIEASRAYNAEELDYFEYLGLTDNDGNLSVAAEQQSLPRYLLLTDTDGEENGGEFEDKIIEIKDKFEKIEEGDHRWFDGGYKAELGDIKLDKKE